MTILSGFEPSKDPPAQQILDGAELVLGVSLPAAFRAVAMRYDGSSGDAEFPVPGANGLGSIGVWLSYRPWAQYSVWSWLGNWSEHSLPKTVVPFGEDGGGNLVCLDYRFGTVPTIAVWFHELSGEDGLYQVAPSFEQWLASVVAADEA